MFDKERLQIDLQGAKKRQEIFKAQLSGAKLQYYEFANEYAQKKVDKLVQIGFGEQNIQLEKELKKSLQQLNNNIAFLSRKKRYKSREQLKQYDEYNAEKFEIEKQCDVLQRIKQTVIKSINYDLAIQNILNELLNVN